MEKFLSFFILHEVFEILLRIELHEVDLIWLAYVLLYDGLVIRSHPEEKPTIVLEDGGDGDAFKLIENRLLTFDDINELGDKDHRIGIMDMEG